jgi:hypothetical protein
VSPDLTDSELERQLTTMLRERAGGLSERVPVDGHVVTRARRRRTAKFASVGSGVALAFAAVVVVVVSVTGSSLSSSKDQPASHGSAVRLTPPTYVVPQPVLPTKAGWARLPAAPMSGRSASAAAVADNAFVVWGGEGPNHVRLTDGAWYDLDSGAWHTMSDSPLPPPSYPAGQHFVVAQAVNDSVVIVSDGSAATYTPRTDLWVRLPDVPLAKLDNLAIPDANSRDVFLLTGVDRGGHAAYAALNFDPLGRTPVWTAGTMTGRSIGRPALVRTGVAVLVHGPGATVQLDRAAEIGEPATATNVPATLPADFKPTGWTGSEMFGGEGEAHFRSTLVAFNPTTDTVRSIVDAYDACAGLHTWTGRVMVSWSGPSCLRLPTGFEVAYNPATGATNGAPVTALAPRTAADFAVALDGRLFVWGGQDRLGDKLSDGAVLTLK